MFFLRAGEQRHRGVVKQISLISLNTNHGTMENPRVAWRRENCSDPYPFFPTPRHSTFLSHVAHAHRFRRRGQHLSAVHHLYQRQVPHRQNHADDACVWRGRNRRKKAEEEVGTVSFVSGFMRLTINERIFPPPPLPTPTSSLFATAFRCHPSPQHKQ